MQRSTFFICTALMIDPTGSSLNIQDDLRNQLKAILPQAFSDNNLDFEKLKQLLGDDFTSPREERYGISWAGKTDAFRELQQTTTNTLSPAPLPPEGGFSLSVTKTPPLGAGGLGGTGAGIFIEGENLEVLKVLQKSYYGKVKMIYIDPPYNTGNDSFVYPDDFSETKAEYQEKGNINLNRLNLWQKNSKDSGKYHSSWLSMMYPRLFMARNLLREDGVIFISIDDNEQANLKLLMDEIFGEENFVACFIWQKGAGTQNDNKYVAISHEYVLFYSKNKENCTLFKLPPTKEMLKTYNLVDEFVSERGKYYLRNLNDFSIGDRPGLHYDIECPDGSILDGKKHRWRCDDKRFSWRKQTGRIIFEKNTNGIWDVFYKQYIFETKEEVIKDENGNILTYGKIPDSLLVKVALTGEGTKEIKEVFHDNIFSYPKPTNLIKHILQITAKNNDIILDFFAGSGTTAQAVMELNAEDGGNRQFICVQMPEPTDEKSEAYKAGYQTIADITRARIQKVCDKLNEAKRKSIEQEKTKNPVFATELNEQFEPFSFKSYRLQASNFKIWQSDIDTEEELLKQLEIYAQPHTEAETPEENLLTELMLKAGFMLTANVQTITTDGIKLYDIENGTMTVALNALSEKVILTICERKPKEFICLDNLFESDVQKSNWSLQLAEAGVNLQVI